MIPLTPISREAYKLLHQGTLALTDVEANGIRVDVLYCKNAQRKLEFKINALQKRMEKCKEIKVWKRKFGSKFNIDSGPQLRYILYDFLGLDIKKETEKGLASIDDKALSKINSPFVKDLLKLRSWKKTKSTYLEIILREEVDGFIHPFFGLIGTRTFRGQSDHPNFQNLPIRNPIIGEIVRKAIIPCKGHILKERDYKGIEVSIAQCYNQDPTLLYDIQHGDMHRDASMKCFKLSKELITKQIRYLGKNMWIFPQFYGDWYGSCAENQWEEIDNPVYALPDGTSLRDHLKSKEIYTLDDFKEHLKSVEEWFWDKKYKVYTKWKEEWIENYWKRGYIDTLTGFRCQGVMDTKQVVNYPIQGSAFHCLLWSLIQTNEFLYLKKFKSKIIGQIHDCLLSDEDRKEENDIDGEIQEIMSVDLKKHFPWITAPMIVETEKTEIDQSWWTKK